MIALGVKLRDDVQDPGVPALEKLEDELDVLHAGEAPAHRHVLLHMRHGTLEAALEQAVAQCRSCMGTLFAELRDGVRLLRLVQRWSAPGIQSPTIAGSTPLFVLLHYEKENCSIKIC